METDSSPEAKYPSQTIESVPDMSIILVCWNNKAYLEPCLQSLYDGGLSSSFEVVVVDNGSTDGSQEMLHEKFPQVQLIQNEGNVGLSRASNQGIIATHGKYVLLLNNDTLVSRSTLDAFVKLLDSTPTAGAVGGKLLNQDGSFQAGYANFSNLLEEFLMATGLGDKLLNGFPSHKKSETEKIVDWLSSACLLLRRKALDQIGLLDENYFIYGDETDLQYRLKEAGWKVYYLPSATTIHFGGRSMNRWKRRKMVYRGKMLFYRKNYSSLKSWLLRIMFGILSILKSIIWGVIWLLPARRERAKLELKSNLDVLKLCWKLE
jgi:GT2 family glycosyltransferase